MVGLWEPSLRPYKGPSVVPSGSPPEIPSDGKGSKKNLYEKGGGLYRKGGRVGSTDDE